METAAGMVKKIDEFNLREENMKAVVEKIMTGEDLYDTLDKALKNQKKRTFVGNVLLENGYVKNNYFVRKRCN